MKNMHLSKIGLFFLLLLLSNSCKKDFLDQQPIVGVTESNFYQTADDAIAAVNSVYATLQFEMTPAGHFRWFWGDIMSDDSKKGGSGENDQPELQKLEEFLGPTNTDFLKAEWEANYIGIYRANLVLEKIPAIDMDGTLKARILGEAKFIRAWFFYNMVTIFGEVPLVDHVLTPEEYTMPQSSKSEIWALVEKDLTEAANDLPLRSGYEAADIGRITKGAAQGLLVKAYLYQQKFGLAESVASEIINSAEYSLAANYEEIFLSSGENGPGSVFEIQHMNGSGGNWGYNQNNEGTFSNVFQRARGSFAGFGFNIPTQSLVDAFFIAKDLDDNPIYDPRLSSTVFREGEPMGDRGIFTKEAADQPHDYYAKKFFSNGSEDATLGDPVPNGGSNDRVIRYADILLMHAEAAYHNGNEEGARSSVNLVRDRARRSNPQLLPNVSATGPALLEAIYKERRLELSLEGHRFFDLVRTGRAGAVLGPLGFIEGVHEVLPIPESQIQASNGSLSQNPGY